jgi:hypothetical protein
MVLSPQREQDVLAGHQSNKSPSASRHHAPLNTSSKHTTTTLEKAISMHRQASQLVRATAGLHSIITLPQLPVCDDGTIRPASNVPQPHHDVHRGKLTGRYNARHCNITRHFHQPAAAGQTKPQMQPTDCRTGSSHELPQPTKPSDAATPCRASSFSLLTDIWPNVDSTRRGTTATYHTLPNARLQHHTLQQPCSHDCSVKDTLKCTHTPAAQKREKAQAAKCLQLEPRDAVEDKNITTQQLTMHVSTAHHTCGALGPDPASCSAPHTATPCTDPQNAIHERTPSMSRQANRRLATSVHGWG